MDPYLKLKIRQDIGRIIKKKNLKAKAVFPVFIFVSTVLRNIACQKATPHSSARNFSDSCNRVKSASIKRPAYVQSGATQFSLK